MGLEVTEKKEQDLGGDSQAAEVVGGGILLSAGQAWSE